jgi:CDP-diacylglycerol--serine O-phosphatidyltransferase
MIPPLGNRRATRYIVGMRYSLRSSFGRPGRRRRFRAVPVRTMVPNIITLLALCAGLTAIRLAAEGTFEWAVYAIVFAAVLDGIDGRVARLLKGTSRFGAELDSLADFVNFGVAPGVTLYFWSLHGLGSAGWIAAMVFAIAAGLRLARFNVMIDDPSRPPWAANFFVGLPAPAGAFTVLLPLYLHFLGLPSPAFAAPLTVVYTLAIAFLMVSRLPVFSGKKVGKRVPPDVLLPVFVSVVLVFALLIAYPWPVLTVGAILYLASLPLGFLAYRDYVRRDAEALAQAGSPAAGPDGRGEAAADVPPPEANAPGGAAGHGAVLPFERGERPNGR